MNAHTEVDDRPARLPVSVRLPLHEAWELVRVGVILAVALLGAALVGAEAAANPHAAPAHGAAALRALIIVMFVGAGLYAGASSLHDRVGTPLIVTGLFSILWLLNGSAQSGPFAVGVLASGVVPALFSWLLLAHPSGRLSSHRERWLIVLAGGSLAVIWAALFLTAGHPTFKTPFVTCGPHCPRSPVVLGSLDPGVVSALKFMDLGAWLTLVVGTALLIRQRDPLCTEPVRRASVPVRFIAGFAALTFTASLAARIAGSPIAGPLAIAYGATAIATPLAIVAGLGLERLFMGRALAEFVTDLARVPNADPQALMAVALRDPSLQIGYRRADGSACVNADGAAVLTDELPPGRAAGWINRGTEPVAVVVYDAEILGLERFVKAAGAAALLRLEQVRLRAELEASTADLAASRVRLVGAADAERQRIERDLHDSVQQDLIALRIRLDMAAEAMQDDPERGQRLLASMGRQMDSVIDTLRSLAGGIYPSLLVERGLSDALKAVARRSPLEVTVDARELTRYPAEVEIAVYFCCVEALQNAVKHAGPNANVRIIVREMPDRVGLLVSDDGIGFDPETISRRHGLLHMRDRVEAVGGSWSLESRPENGTTIRASVPYMRQSRG